VADPSDRSSIGERLARGDGSMFNELFEILAEAVTVRDPTGAIVYANAAALSYLGFDSLEELQATPSTALLDRYLVEDEHGRAVSQPELPSVQTLQGRPQKPLLMRTVNRITGELRWTLLKTTALRSDDGIVLGALTVLDDVTAVKNAEMRTRVLAESGRILSTTLDYHQTLRNVAEVAVPSLADYCAVDLVDEQGLVERTAACHRDPSKQEVATSLGELAPAHLDQIHPAARVLATGTSELFAEITDSELEAMARDEPHLEALRNLSPRSVMLVPLRVPNRTIGVMTLATDASERRFHPDDVEVAEQLARRAAVAVENSRLHTKLSDIATTLQGVLLPRELPQIPGWELASLYRPAQTDLRVDVGGDFYEFLEHDGTWFGVFGDVTGKGIQAAAMTTLMRTGARVACRIQPQPAAILARLDEALALESGKALCTALCMCLHRDHMVISSAGHPPAIIVSADGTLREVPTPGPVLGAFPDASWPEENVPMTPGELIFFYTDGVTETTGDGGRFGADRLRELLAQQGGASPATVVNRLDSELDSFTGGSVLRDDVAVVALRAAPRAA
jgi:PAS domain S-box-containing protein